MDSELQASFLRT